MSFGKLEITYASGQTATVALTKRQMTLGRASDMDVPINDGQVSRRHALLLCGPEGVRLVDAGSANGTHLGNVRLPAEQPVPLPDGAMLRVGTTRIRYVAEQEPAAVPEPVADSAPSAPDHPVFDTAIKPPAGPGSVQETRPPVSPTPPAFTPPPQPPRTPDAGHGEPERQPGPPGVPADRSNYLKYLPAMYSADDFLGRFLLIFESILSPIERTVGNLHFYFDARLTPPEVLPWLASWLGLVLDERWPEQRRRDLIRAAVELYQWRGTRRGLSEFLRLYTGLTPEIIETAVDRRATSESGAFRFVVRLRGPHAGSLDRALVEAIIDAEKPAHAGYTLEIEGA